MLPPLQASQMPPGPPRCRRRRRIGKVTHSRAWPSAHQMRQIGRPPGPVAGTSNTSNASIWVAPGAPRWYFRYTEHIGCVGRTRSRPATRVRAALHPGRPGSPRVCTRRCRCRIGRLEAATGHIGTVGPCWISPSRTLGRVRRLRLPGIENCSMRRLAGVRCHCRTRWLSEPRDAVTLTAGRHNGTVQARGVQSCP